MNRQLIAVILWALVVVLFMAIVRNPYEPPKDDLSVDYIVNDNFIESEQKDAQIVNMSPTSITVEVTAYCPCEKCCGKTDGITACGEKAVEGVTIAADWDVFPAYTQLYIDGVGYRTVHDKGGAIKGNRIDIFFASHEEALAFGRKTLTVTEVIYD